MGTLKIKIGIVSDGIDSLASIPKATKLLEQGVDAALQGYPDRTRVELVCDSVNHNLLWVVGMVALARSCTFLDIAQESADCNLLDYVDVIISLDGNREDLEMVALFQEWGGETYEYNL